MKSENPAVVIGGTIQSIGYWEPVVVLGTDGVLYEVRIVIGHSGPEFEVTKARGR